MKKDKKKVEKVDEQDKYKGLNKSQIEHLKRMEEAEK